MGNVKTTVQFIEDAKKVHGDTYDYSLVNYVASNKKIIIKTNIIRFITYF